MTVTVKGANVQLCHSRTLFVRRLRARPSMVFDAHGRAFAFFKGACTRGIYHNMGCDAITRDPKSGRYKRPDDYVVPRACSEEFSQSWHSFAATELARPLAIIAGRFHASITAARQWHSRRHCPVEQVTPVRSLHPSRNPSIRGPQCPDNVTMSSLETKLENVEQSPRPAGRKSTIVKRDERSREAGVVRVSPILSSMTCASRLSL